MAYSDPNKSGGKVNWRQSIDSTSRGSFDNRESVDSTSLRVVTDALYLKINDLDRMNARIKKSILVFKDLDQH